MLSVMFLSSSCDQLNKNLSLNNDIYLELRYTISQLQSEITKKDKLIEDLTVNRKDLATNVEIVGYQKFLHV